MQAIASEQQTLLDNLRTAFENESNARLRYGQFGEKADGEGWHGVASLFRAAARAEEIHAANHGRVLHQLGGSIEYYPGDVTARSTLDSLRTALAGEAFEADTLYPAFLEQARAARDVAAVRTFTWALHAEWTHLRLFNEALALLEIDDEDSWVTMPREFYVCPVCGYTSESPDELEMCPTCYCSWSRFEACR